MKKSELESAVKRAITNLFENQPDILALTSATGQTEWNLTHHFAVELSAFFPSLDYDLDVVKKDYGNTRPDIVFHERGTHSRNFLVVEVKRDGSNREIEADVRKIKRLWFKRPLNYRFGAMVDLRTKGKHQIRVFKNTATRRVSV